jgi:hypothetical protein
MQYASQDPRNVENETAVTHCANRWKRKREILWEWLDPCLQKLNQGVAFSKYQRVCIRMSSWNSIENVLNVVEKCHVSNKPQIFVNKVSTTGRGTNSLVRMLLAYIATTKKGHYTNQLTNLQLMVLQPSTIGFYMDTFGYCIVTLFFTLPTKIWAIQQLTAGTFLSIQIRHHFGDILIVPHTWMPILLVRRIVTSISISSMMKQMYGDCTLVWRSIDQWTGA